MKSFFSSTALVLKRHPFGESGLMVTLLAKGQGKMTLLAKGERKLSSRLCGKLEPFQTLRVEGRLGRGLGIVQEAETMIHFPLWKLDLPAQNALGFLAELSHRLIADGQECDQAMELWEEAMGCWPSHEAKTDILLHAFCIRLLSGLGFMANWKECGVSGQRLDLEKPIYLDPEEVRHKQVQHTHVGAF